MAQTTLAVAPTRPLLNTMGRNVGMRRLGKYCFHLFLVAQFFSLSREFFFAYVGEDLTTAATIAGIGSLVLLLPALWGYANYAGNALGFLMKAARVWIWWMFLYTALLFLYGLGEGYSINAIAQDYGPFLIVMVCAILGSIPEFWDDQFSIFLVLTIAGFIVNAVGLQNLGDLFYQFGYMTRVTSDVLAYETRSSIELWPILLLTAQRWGRGMMWVIIGISVLALMLQILFQKRLPVAEVLAYIFCFWFIVPRFARRWKTRARVVSNRLSRGLFVVVLVAAAALSLVAAPQVVVGQTSALLARYGLEDLSRVGEAVGMLEYLHDHEYFIGRGLGGYFQYTDSTGFTWGSYLDDVGEVGKRTTHMSLLMPMLKGGLIFMIIYYMGIVLALRNSRQCLNDGLSLAALIIVVTKILVSLQGSYLLMAGSFETIVFGLSMGRVLTFNRGGISEVTE